MASGVTVSQEALGMINKVRSRKVDGVVFMMNEGLTEIVVDQVMEKIDILDAKGASGGDKLEAVKKFLPPDEPRYAIFDFSYNNQDDQLRDAVVFISWAPDTARTKLKMLYASSKGAFQKVMGTVTAVQAAEECDITFHEVRCKCLKN